MSHLERVSNLWDINETTYLYNSDSQINHKPCVTNFVRFHRDDRTSAVNVFFSNSVYYK